MLADNLAVVPRERGNGCPLATPHCWPRPTAGEGNRATV